MALNLNSEVQNLPGVQDREMDKLIAVRATLMLFPGLQDRDELKYWSHAVVPWLESSRNNGDKLLRRYLVLAAAENRSGFSEADPSKFRRFVEELYAKT